jgi:hypothetical protein
MWGGATGMINRILQTFAEVLKAKFALSGSASPEDQLKQPIFAAIESAGRICGLTILSRTEVHLSEHKVRPDVAIYVGGCAKADRQAQQGTMGKAKRPPQPNLHGWSERGRYRNGERIGAIARFKVDPTDTGKAAITTENADQFEALIHAFLIWIPTVPHKPSEHAKYLAPLTRYLRGEVEHALSMSGSDVALLATEWRQYFFGMS